MIERRPIQYGKTYINNVDLNYLHSEDFIDNVINSFINEQKDIYNNSGLSYLNTFNQDIETYRVNDRIVSIKVSILITNENNEEYLTFVNKGFTFDLEEKKELKLNDFFDSRYQKDLNIKPTENFVLTNKKVIFLYDNSRKDVSFKKLKNYNASFLLTAKNYRMSEKKYNKYFFNE